jgi:putative membrane protein
MSLKPLLICGAVVALGTPGLAQQGPGTAAPPQATTSSLPAAPSSMDFVRMAAQTDEYERQAGQLAVSRATNAEVRDFGKMMVSDHTATSADLIKAAQEAGLKPPPPPPLHPDQQKMIAALQSGAKFDATYIDQQVQAHREALALMQVYASNGADAPLRAAAAKTAPIVQHHLMMAEQIKGRLR